MAWHTELDIAHDGRFACRLCAACCRDRRVVVSPLERQVIESTDWASVSPRLAGRALFDNATTGETGRAEFMARVHGACVFLESDGRCLLYSTLGPGAMPLACRLFPIVFAEEPASTIVSASYACPAISDGFGPPLRDQESTIRKIHGELRLSGSTLPFRVPERIVLCADIGLDWYSYLAMERFLADLLEENGHPLHERLLAMHRLIDMATIVYGNGSKTAPHFKLWIEKMAEGSLRSGLFNQSCGHRRASAFRQRAALAPLIFAMESWQSAEQAPPRHPPRRLGLRGLLRGRGTVYMHSMDRVLDLEAMGQVRFSQDAPGVQGLMTKFMGECLRRKLLLRRKSLVRGIQYLLACFALVRWYSVAAATSRECRIVEKQDLRFAIALVERGYSCDGLAAGSSADRSALLSAIELAARVSVSPAELVANLYQGL